MKNTGLAVIVAVAIIAGFLAGTAYGFKQGIENFSLLDQITRGAIATYNLSYIETDRVDLVQFSMELDIDSGLHRYILYQDSGNKVLSNAFLPGFTSEIDSYVDLMAEHRQSHAMVFGPKWADPVEGDNVETRLWRENERVESEQMVEDIKSLLRDRGVSEAALSKQSDLWPANP